LLVKRKEGGGTGRECPAGGGNDGTKRRAYSGDVKRGGSREKNSKRKSWESLIFANYGIVCDQQGLTPQGNAGDREMAKVLAAEEREQKTLSKGGSNRTKAKKKGNRGASRLSN